MKFEITGVKEFETALARNPTVVVNELKDFFVRGIAIYKSIIWNNPWRMGMTGGGVPVALVNGGTLRASHQTKYEKFSARIFPTASYKSYVHGIDGMARKRTYQLRPWLDYAYNKGEAGVRVKEKEMLKNIVKQLAK
jgi:hypothetical protein